MRGIKGLILILSFSLLFSGSIIMEYEYSEEEAELYRIDIEQVTPDSGITTGHVIAYGHYIKPPYKIEIRDDTLVFVNNVQVFPALVTEGEKKKREEEKRLPLRIRRKGLKLGRK